MVLNLPYFLYFFPLVVQTERQVSRWFVQCLREQSMLLEIIFLYYAYFEMAPSDLLVLTKMFKEQGFGSRQTNRHLVDETMDRSLGGGDWSSCAGYLPSTFFAYSSCTGFEQEIVFCKGSVPVN